ncbi:dihydrofolate reductase [Aridibaculum aurantiacum]|uniref:dihydrofolate reductase n=1 Tax=Aridibaculum aurantiacum TaxID=2810307 RepID=UPI001A966FD7|nr:dihydrofolate reductase [Aridibaculum aurantiacum]
MTVSLIVAASTNHAIGIGNQLPWHLPTDMKFFKNTTWGLPVIMGRKTYESMNSKPLPGRVNIIITRQEDWSSEGVQVAASVEDALTLARKTDCKEAFVIGGGEIFSLVMDHASKIYMTRVHTELVGDVFFPAIDEKQWKLVEQRDVAKDEKHAYDFTIEKWERIIPFSVE